MLLTVKRLDPRAKIPTRAHDGDAGLDLYAIEDAVLPPGVPVAVRTGLSIEIPAGYYGAVVPRSGLALKHGMVVVNAPGTIDSGYRGEVKVILRWDGHHPNEVRYNGDFKFSYPIWSLTNCEIEDVAESRYMVRPGDRIAQLIIHRCEPVGICEGELSETERGEGGFGSSGK